MEGQTLEQRLLTDKEALWTERRSYDELCRDLAKFVSPRMGRFELYEKNRGEKKHQAIFESTAIGAHKTLRAGLRTGLTNPSTTWLRLKTPDAELNKDHAVRVWLEEAAQRLMEIFNDSNTYEALSHYYGESSLFGTACGIIEEDEETVIHHYPLTWGQYALATDDKGRVNKVIREFQMTVAQVIKKFGEENVSEGVRGQADRQNWHQPVTIYHCVEPRWMHERDPEKLDGKNMPWRSVYFEICKNNNGQRGKRASILRESGYREFPVVAPRWEVVGGNTYGDSPAMDALGAVQRVQSMTVVEGRAAALDAEPPLQGPPSLKDAEIDRGPNGYTEVEAGQEIKPLYDSRTNPVLLENLLQRGIHEIEARMFRPLFSIISDADKQMTAQEVREVAGERLAQLGPTIGRYDRDLLSRMVDITLGHAFDQGRMPPAPDQLAGLEVKAELVGVLAQAQRASNASTSDQLQAKVFSHAQVDPRVRHIIDYEQDIRNYADVIGADPRSLVSPQKYQETVEAEAQAQAAQAQSAVVAEQAGAARDMAQAEAAGA